ncbi:cytochrome c [Sphingobacterium psychroaquaticum]|uniref:c-type cytochrome n=1 Tax=Sphingobacterium psychroaquaticum TaxID=561061 RepID=UPI0010696B81|nr:cytochrome c [Sphingobacterium psychroaquaticum]QBQ41793.1 cytochrome c [Sphingobacterium psychroaquaticum]
MLLQINTPVPKDIPLDLPLPEWLLVTLLIVSFLLHIIFINLMVGGSIVVLWAQVKGLKDKQYDVFAYEIAKTITVNKSIAVVLGVAPLLSINTLYTVYFYSANALTGFAWIMIIPLVTIAFLLTYLHKYSWSAMKNHKALHIGIIALSVLIFLFIPLIFLTNVNLMMFPEKWGTIKGFLSALVLPNVFPRYFEFLGACVSVTGVFIVWYNGRKNYPFEEIYNNFTRAQVKRVGYHIALVGLAGQIVFGAIVLMTLPAKGVSFEVIEIMGVAGGLLVLALWWIWQTVKDTDENLNRHFWKITIAIFVFMICYGGSRQMYRHNALDKHQQMMAAHTASFQALSKEARENYVEEEPELEIDESLGDLAKGTALFQASCSGCHQLDQQLVGPPIREMKQIYEKDEPKLIAWIKAPGRKRMELMQMPGFPQIPDEDLKEIAKYILSVE